ncbi:hypothetical protein AXF42_Ash006526 [Apostasia shenzhenica]|uniref:Uncharacterized protein n=1 Tax=Apostasia shenzhenica TaxID=1088818 RepID=A0A2I0AZB8_9ASPA|nr:hypothetical protein AXF42_Ash006526 [Apostasia shenzhenica]
MNETYKVPKLGGNILVKEQCSSPSPELRRGRRTGFERNPLNIFASGFSVEAGDVARVEAACCEGDETGRSRRGRVKAKPPNRNVYFREKLKDSFYSLYELKSEKMRNGIETHHMWSHGYLKNENPDKKLQNRATLLSPSSSPRSPSSPSATDFGHGAGRRRLLRGPEQADLPADHGRRRGRRRRHGAARPIRPCSSPGCSRVELPNTLAGTGLELGRQNPEVYIHHAVLAHLTSIS